MPDPEGLPVVLTLGEAMTAGLSRMQVQRRVEQGRWRRLRPGVFQRMGPARQSAASRFEADRQQHVAAAVAAMRRYPQAVVALESAGAWHQFALRSVPGAKVELLVPHGTPRGPRATVRLHLGSLPSHHLTPVQRDGSVRRLRVSSRERTWVDLARTRTLADALMAGDAALRSGAVSLHGLKAMAEECADLRGAGKALRALEHLSALRESPLESDSWAYFVEHRLPLPEMQVDLFDDHGRFLGRADYWWKHARLVGECDGRSKYIDPSVLYEEKRREDAIRAEGNDVIRWGAPDLHDDRLAERIETALQRAARR